MFTPKLTKEIIKKHLDISLGFSTNIKDKDIEIDNKNIIIRLRVTDKSLNFVETAIILQKQLAYVLNDYTDSKDYKIDIILSE